MYRDIYTHILVIYRKAVVKQGRPEATHDNTDVRVHVIHYALVP